MSLKVIKLGARKKLLDEKLTERKLEQNKLKKRTDEISTAYDEIENEEDLELLDNESEELISRLESVESEIAEIQSEIDEIEKTINEVNEKNKAVEDNKKNENDRGTKKMAEKNVRNSNDFRDARDRKEQLRSICENHESRGFLEKLVNHVQKREILNADLTIPTQIIDMIKIDLETTNSVYNIVNNITLGGNGRILIAGDTPSATWLECCDPLESLDLNFGMIELDCYKLGAYVAICNSHFEDAFIDLADYVIKQLTKSFRIALDKGILTGTGIKQPLGIKTAVADKTVTTQADFNSIMSYFGNLPDDTANTHAVMTRKTFYSYFAGQIILPTSDGKLVMSTERILPDGTKVIFCDKGILDDDEMILGDFSRYVLGVRKNMTVEKSTENMFIQDNTVVRAVARYDGKPTDKNYFIHFKFVGGTKKVSASSK